MKATKSDFDVIVVGAGIGGLTAAAKLCKEGKRTLVLEKHSLAGGYATTFQRRDFTFEAGLHAIDGLYDEHNPNLKIFQELGITQNISFIRLPEFYRVKRGPLSITLPDNVTKARICLESHFPSCKKKISAFFKRIVDVRKEILHVPTTKKKIMMSLPILPFKYPRILRHLRSNLGGFMDTMITNEDLKIALSANVGYYHDNPYQYSLLHYCGAQGSYFSGGCAYIKGGSKKLADYLVTYISDHGGEVRLKHVVDHIMVDRNRVKGIQCHNGSSEKKIVEYADYVVANAPMPSVIQEMLPGSYGKMLKRKFGHYSISHSIFSLYLGLRSSPASIGNKNYSTFILPESLKTLKMMSHFNKTDDFGQKVLAFIDYSQIDAQLSPANKSTATCAVIDTIDKWIGLSPGEYKAKKEAACKTIIERLEKFLPGFSDTIEYYEAATPRTMMRYTANPCGSIYGFEQSPNQVGAQRPDIYSGIPGLYFASAWTKPGGGITPVAKCGYNAACEILNKG